MISPYPDIVGMSLTLVGMGLPSKYELPKMLNGDGEANPRCPAKKDQVVRVVVLLSEVQSAGYAPRG